MPAYRYDVITFGESMLRLTPPGFQRLESVTTLEVEVGGSESNVAVGLARLGLRVAWLSRLTDNPLGEAIVAALRAQQVDTAHVIRTPGDRVGLYFLEDGRAPRGSRVWYDRAHSAFSHITPADLPADLFRPEVSRVLHFSGITPALGPNIEQTALEAARRAKAAGWSFSFDLNYRTALWSPEAAMRAYDVFGSLADFLFLPLRDAVHLYETPSEPHGAFEKLQARFPGRIIVLTLGDTGAGAALPSGEALFHPGFAAEIVDRVGGGDAFVAGFLCAYLQSGAVADALAWGNAAAAYKYSIPGDMPRFSRAELEELLRSGSQRGLKR